MNELKAGAVLNYIAICLNMLVGLIYTPFMLRMLGQSEYGLYSLASSVIAYLAVLDLGFGNAIIRYTAKFRAQGKHKEQEEMFGMFFVLYICIGIIALIAGGILTLNVENMFSQSMSQEEISRTKVIMALMTFNLAFTFPMSIWGSIMMAYERFVFQKLVSVLRTVLNPVVMIFFLFAGYKAITMVIVTTIFNIVTLLINWWYCKYRLDIKVRFAKFKFAFLKEVSIYSFWIFLNAIMDRIYWSTGQFVLGIYKGTIAVAIYAVAIQFQGFYMMFSTAVSSVFLPKVTAMVTRNSSNKELSDLFIRTGRIQYIVMSFILSSFIVFGRPFIKLWAGESYSDAYYICLMFLIPLTIPLIQNLGITILQARNQMKFRSILYIVIALASLLLSISLAKKYGGYGCAFSTSLALIIGQVIIMNIYYYYRQNIDIVKFWVEISKMSIVPILSILIGLYFVNNFLMMEISIGRLFVFGLIFMTLFIVAFWKFSLNKKEKELFYAPFAAFQRNKK